jgi:hypothetical protein
MSGRSYIQGQAKWVRENNIGIGSKVIIKQGMVSYGRGWNNIWHNEPMTFAIGSKPFKVVYIDQYYGHGIYLELFGEKFAFPYFVLEPVKEI